MAIAKEKFERILQLLDEDVLTDRQIAADVGISRSTVCTIKKNRVNPASGPKPKERVDVMYRVLKTPVKCPTCNSMILLVPCVGCNSYGR